MKKLFGACLASVALLGFTARAGENLTNGDLKEGLAGWHGDGSAVFLNPDGSEGSEGDPNVTPAIKLTLVHGNVHSVYQEFTIRDHSSSITYKVDITAPAKISRSTSRVDFTDELFDYHPGDYFNWTVVGVCNVDFWIRAGVDGVWNYLLAAPGVGQWSTLSRTVSIDPNATDLTVNFCVPPGEGTVYLRNASAVSTGGN